MSAAGDVGRFQVIPAAYLVLRRRDEVLLQLRQNTGYMDGRWACAAAGHVEQGESVLAAAVREAEEELGLVISEADLVPLTVMHRTTPGGGPIEERVDVFFALTGWEGQPTVREPDKSAGLRWFPLADLPESTVPHERAVLDALAAGTLAPVVAYGF